MRFSMGMKYLIVIPTLFSIGCSGGGGSTPSVPNTGVYLDSAVEGISYTTSTVSGITNANGEFQYNDGETVTLSLYGQQISQVPGYNLLTPLDNSISGIHDDYSVNVLRLLQTLDTDGDPTNGITLPVVSGIMNINFDQSMDDFSNDAAVVNFVSANSNSTLVTPVDAVIHFLTTLSSVSDSYTLDITGRSASSVITTSYCNTDVQGGFDYTFTSTDYTATGIDTIISNNFADCTLGASSTFTDNYNTFPDFGLDCGPVCSYNEVNRVITGVDGDGRDFITTIWHTPNTNIVTYTKRITNDPDPGWNGVPYAFKEIITLH